MDLLRTSSSSKRTTYIFKCYVHYVQGKVFNGYAMCAPAGHWMSNNYLLAVVCYVGRVRECSPKQCLRSWRRCEAHYLGFGQFVRWQSHKVVFGNPFCMLIPKYLH